MFFKNAITINAETFNDVVIQTIQELFSDNIKLYTRSGKFGVRGTMFKHCKIEDKCYFAFYLESSRDKGKYDTNYVIETVYDTERKTITIKVADSEYGDKKCVNEKVLILSKDSCDLDRIGHIHIKQPFLIDKVVTLYIMLYVRLQTQPDNNSFYNISFSSILSDLLEDDVLKEYILRNNKHIDTIFQVVIHESTAYYTSFEPTPKALKDYMDNMDAICDIAQKVTDKTDSNTFSKVIDNSNRQVMRQRLDGLYDKAQGMFNTQALLNQANSDQFIITARSCWGKSWFGLKSIMEVYRNGEVDLGGTKIMKVTFNYPATIVEWDDGTKTVVKARDDEPFDHEKGLAMAIAKKALGNDNSYYMIFKDAMYEPVEKKPKDWNTNYTEYFTRTSTDYKPVGIIVDRKTGCAKVPEFVSGKYYKPKKTYLGAN